MQTIQRTDAWLVYDGDPESLRKFIGKTVCVEIPAQNESEMTDGAYGVLEDRSYLGTTHSSDDLPIELCVVRGLSFTPIRKGDLIRAL